MRRFSKCLQNDPCETFLSNLIDIHLPGILRMTTFRSSLTYRNAHGDGTQKNMKISGKKQIFINNMSEKNTSFDFPE